MEQERLSLVDSVHTLLSKSIQGPDGLKRSAWLIAWKEQSTRRRLSWSHFLPYDGKWAPRHKEYVCTKYRVHKNDIATNATNHSILRNQWTIVDLLDSLRWGWRWDFCKRQLLLFQRVGKHTSCEHEPAEIIMQRMQKVSNILGCIWVFLDLVAHRHDRRQKRIIIIIGAQPP